MKRVLTVALMIITLIGITARAEEVTQYAYNDFKQIVNEIEQNTKDLISGLEDDEKYGYSNYSDCYLRYYNNLFEKTLHETLDGYDIKTGEEVTFNCYVDNVEIIDTKTSRYLTDDILKNGLLRIAIKGTPDDIDSEEMIYVRTNDLKNYFIEKNTEIRITGTYMKDGCYNQRDSLFDCTIDVIADNGEKLPQNNDYMYLIAQDIVKSNLGSSITFPEYSEDSKEIYINNTGEMCEVISYANVKNKEGWEKNIGFDVQFKYEKSNNTNDYHYDTFYAYIEGYEPYGEAVSIGSVE